MTVSIRRMSAGAGYQYLLRSVAAGDGQRALSTPLTRYYSEVGTPPGRWIGSGLTAFGSGQIETGMRVTEEQLALLIGMGRDPLTGDQLGRAYPSYKRMADRVKERVAALDSDMSPEDRAAETTRIEAEESASGVRQAVAGFDLTFSVPKSVSVLWGVGDATTQERIVAAHHAAIADVIGLFEREVAATRTGISDSDGAIAQVGVAGIAAASYDHFDSRSGDPQLHTHVVIANKVLTERDGCWRSLDGRAVFASRTGLSALYDAILADRLSREVGVEWELRQRGPDRNPRWEIVGVTDDLITEFSGRTREIEKAKNELIAAYVARHGRQPSGRVIVELRAQATIATRPPKHIRSLADLTAEWRDRAGDRLRTEPSAWSRTLIDHFHDTLTAPDIPQAVVDAIGAAVVAAVGEKRPVWTHWNLMAEASKQTMDLRFATTEDREAVVDMVVAAAQMQSVVLTPPELAISPASFRRDDGTSVFRPRHGQRYSSTAVLDAEARLLSRADRLEAPTVPEGLVGRWVESRGKVRLTAQQRTVVQSIATSARQVEVLVGPAGAGKTTTMRALRAAWIAEFGRGSVVGLAPSATASEALARDLGVACENTSKWLHEYDRGRAELLRDQLMIVDEATLADTVALDRLAGIAAAAGAKILLVGDPHQLNSVDAGGAFALLVSRRTDAPTLSEIHRFNHEWEKAASLAMSRGDVQVISTYALHERIREGDTDEMVNAAYDAWRADSSEGRASILVTGSAREVQALNDRARAERLRADGAVSGHEVDLVDGSRASAGDIVITRLNDRRLRTTRGGWVKNGDRWRIVDIRRDNSIVVKRVGPGQRGTAVLPPAYVAEHLDLGYAVTAHRAQGVTVDTAHVVVTPATTRENLYVSMTRGRESNTAYVALDQPDDSHAAPLDEDQTARSVLFGVLQHVGADSSATQTIETEYEIYGGIDRLAAELESVAADVQHDRFVDLLTRSGLSPEEQTVVVSSSAFGPLAAALRRAEAQHHDLEQLVPRIVGRHGLGDAEDLAAVLRARVEHLASSVPTGCRLRPRLIAGLIPEPLGPMSAEDRQAIDERKELIEARARRLAGAAHENGNAWIRRLGPKPNDSEQQARWYDAATTVAAYRDRYKVTSDLPLGGEAVSAAQSADRERALAAMRAARAIGESGRRETVPAIEIRAVSGP